MAARKKTKARKSAPAPKEAAARKAPAKKYAARADLGAPVDGFFAKQPPHLRPITDALRALVAKGAPAAVASIKWGMPLYTVNGAICCAIGAHKSHVNLILSGPEGTYADPDGLLEGTGKTGKHLKLVSLADLPKSTVLGWIKVAAARAKNA
jgi:hypothetical protein